MTKYDNGDGQMARSTRSLFVLEILAESGKPMTPSEINQSLNLPKATIHRLCQMLEAEGFLEKDLGERGYIPGKRQRNLAQGVFAFSSFSQTRIAILEKLSAQIGETCNLVVPSDSGMLYLERAETSWPLRIQLKVGERVPYHCSASGKLYLSTLRKSQRDALIENLDLKGHAKNTITEREALKAELTAIRKQGYSIDHEEFIDGMIALAVPIFNNKKKLLATLATHGPTLRLTETGILNFVDHLQTGAEAIRETLCGDEEVREGK